MSEEEFYLAHTVMDNGDPYEEIICDPAIHRAFYRIIDDVWGQDEQIRLHRRFSLMQILMENLDPAERATLLNSLSWAQS